ncbi:MAG: YciI family protein [Acidobacteriaceae bacterium]
MKSWFVRINPSRPTFDQEATPAEHTLMARHFQYWTSLQKKGVCVCGGPVLDPRGTYDIFALRAETRDDALAFASADPSVQAGLNTIEVTEMRLALL